MADEGAPRAKGELPRAEGAPRAERAQTAEGAAADTLQTQHSASWLYLS